MIPIEDIIKGALIFIRIGGILFFLPIFGDAPTPVRARILLACALTAGLYSLVPGGVQAQTLPGAAGLAVLISKELFIGFTIGMIAKILFAGLIMAAGIVGYQMGFGTSNILMPDANQKMNSFLSFHRILIIMIFLGLSLHHIFIKAISDSFLLIPIGVVLPDGGLTTMMIGLTAGIFSISLQLASPILVALLFTMAALGLIARTVPQINVFTLSFPVSFFIGLLVYAACIPFYPGIITSHFGEETNSIIMGIKGLMP